MYKVQTTNGLHLVLDLHFGLDFGK